MRRWNGLVWSFGACLLGATAFLGKAYAGSDGMGLAALMAANTHVKNIDRTYVDARDTALYAAFVAQWKEKTQPNGAFYSAFVKHWKDHMKAYDNEPWKQHLTAEYERELAKEHRLDDLERAYGRKAGRLSGEIQGLHSQLGAGNAARARDSSETRAIRKALTDIVAYAEVAESEAAKFGGEAHFTDAARGLLKKLGAR